METWARGGGLLAEVLEITSTVIGSELVLTAFLLSGGWACYVDGGYHQCWVVFQPLVSGLFLNIAGSKPCERS